MALSFRAPFPEDNIFLRVMAVLSLLQVLLYPLPLYNALHRLFDPVFRHLHFRPQGRPQNSGRQTPSLSKPPEKDRTFSRGGRGTSPPQANPSETPCWLVIPEPGLFTGIAIVGAVGSGKPASCVYPFAEQILAYRDEDYRGADKDDPIYYAPHTVMKAQAELQRQSSDEQAGEDQRTTTKEIALDH